MFLKTQVSISMYLIDLLSNGQLEYLFMRILAIHFFGMYCLEREEKEKENSGLLYGLASELDV